MNKKILIKPFKYFDVINPRPHRPNSQWCQKQLQFSTKINFSLLHVSKSSPLNIPLTTHLPVQYLTFQTLSGNSFSTLHSTEFLNILHSSLTHFNMTQIFHIFFCVFISSKFLPTSCHSTKFLSFIYFNHHHDHHHHTTACSITVLSLCLRVRFHCVFISIGYFRFSFELETKEAFGEVLKRKLF